MFGEMETLLTLLLLGAVVGIVVAKIGASLRKLAWRTKYGRHPKNIGRPTFSNGGVDVSSSVPIARHTDASDQLRIVMDADFSAQPLLNKGEVRLFRELEAMVSACNPRWLVMAQVSLGEILKSQNADAYRCINSKRVDLLLVDENCRPQHVIEYQGHGHHQGSAAARDAVKKEALRRAGIGYHEVVAGKTTPSELKQLVRKLVGVSDYAEPRIISTSADRK